MTAALAELTDSHRRRPAVRALATGALVTTAATAFALGVGVAPAGLGDYVWLGAGAAFASGVAATTVHALLLRGRAGAGGNDARLQAMRVQATLGIGFLAKLVGLSIGVGALVAAGLKFEAIACFAIAFAAASLVFQLCTALSLARGAARVTPGVASASGSASSRGHGSEPGGPTS